MDTRVNAFFRGSLQETLVDARASLPPLWAVRFPMPLPYLGDTCAFLARPLTTELFPVCELHGTVSCQTSFMQF